MKRGKEYVPFLRKGRFCRGDRIIPIRKQCCRRYETHFVPRNSCMYSEVFAKGIEGVPGGRRTLAIVCVSPRRRIGRELRHKYKISKCVTLLYSEERYIYDLHIPVVQGQRHRVFWTNGGDTWSLSVLLSLNRAEVIEHVHHSEGWRLPLRRTPEIQTPVVCLVSHERKEESK